MTSEFDAAVDGDEVGDSASDDEDRSHLEDLEAGAGCTEIWEHLSERREASGASD